MKRQLTILKSTITILLMTLIGWLLSSNEKSHLIDSDLVLANVEALTFDDEDFDKVGIRVSDKNDRIWEEVSYYEIGGTLVTVITTYQRIDCNGKGPIYCFPMDGPIDMQINS